MFSGAASADPAAVYWNPAAMTLLQGTQAMIYSSIILLEVRHQRATPNPIDNQLYPEASFNIASAAPTFGLVTDATTKNWRFGLGFAIPFADASDWQPTYEGKAAGTRHHGAGDPLLGELLISGAVAYRINRMLSLAVGIDVAGLVVRHRFFVDFGARVNQLACQRFGGQNCSLDSPLPREDPANDGPVQIDGFGWSAGIAAGLLFEPLRWLRMGLGLHYNAGFTGGAINVPTEIVVRVPTKISDFVNQTLPGLGLPPLVARGDLTMNVPLIINASIFIQPVERLELTLDLHWMDMSVTQTLVGIIRESTTALIGDVVLVKGRSDSFVVGTRGSYDILPNLKLGLRVEYGSNTRPEEFVTPTSLDLHRLSFHFGMLWHITRWLQLGAEFAHFIAFDRDIRVSRFAPNANPQSPVERGFDLPSPTGQYSVSSERFGVSLTFKF